MKRPAVPPFARSLDAKDLTMTVLMPRLNDSAVPLVNPLTMVVLEVLGLASSI